MGRVIGYIRVSTQGQSEDGISLDAQRARIAGWAAFNGYALAGVFEDAGLSGADPHRPGLSAALGTIRQGDALVVCSLSRLSRSTRDMLELSDRLGKAGADLVSISEKIDTTTAAGTMVFQMLAVLSEFERNQTRERTRAALAHKKSQGQRTGSIPYGKRLAADGKALVDDPADQAVVCLVRALRVDGANYSEIARELTARGLKPRGTAWHAQTVKNIVRAA